MITSKQKAAKASDYKRFLHKQLQDPSLAAEYLNASFDEGADAFLVALRDVAEAHGTVKSSAKVSASNKLSVKSVLSAGGKPDFSGVAVVLDMLGVKLTFTPKNKRKRVA